MDKEAIKQKLNRLSAGQSSGWEQKAIWRKANRSWLDKSARIALKIVRALRVKKLSQKDLADMMGTSAQHISKLLKGQENFTLETISRIEMVLGIDLITISVFSSRMEISAEMLGEKGPYIMKKATSVIKSAQPVQQQNEYHASNLVTAA